MSAENKEIARRFTVAFAAGDTDTLSEIVAEDVIDHNARPGQAPGRQALIDAVNGFKSGFPNDLETSIEQEVAEGDLVVHYGVMSGTNTGELMGRPASNERVAFAWMDIHRVQDGKIVESGISRTSPGCVPRWV
jgi:predicted ester cyclase